MWKIATVALGTLSALWPPQVEAQPAAPHMRIMLTYPADIMPAARRLATPLLDNFYEKGFQRCTMECTRVGPTITNEILVRTSYWVPFIVEQFRREFPESDIEVVPGVLDMSSSGNLYYSNIVYDPLSSVRVDFSVFVRDVRQGGASFEPTTYAKRYSGLFVITPTGFPGGPLNADQAFAASSLIHYPKITTGLVVADLANMSRLGSDTGPSSPIAIPFKQHKMSEAQWQSFLNSSPRLFVSSSGFLDEDFKLILVAIGKLNYHSASANRDELYASVLGVDYSSVPEERRVLLSAMQDAESKFIRAQADGLVAYLHSSDEALATRSMFISEQDAVQQKFNAGWALLGSAVAGGVTPTLVQQDMEQTAAGSAAAQTRISALAPVMSQQVALASSNAQLRQSLTAKSLAELRAKFRMLLGR